MTRAKVTIPYLFEKKTKKEPITMLTCYDYPMALLEEKAEIDIVLCGDSLGMTVYGYNGTLPVTMDMMVVHAAAVTRGAPTAFVIGDMPFLSYQVSKEEPYAMPGALCRSWNRRCQARGRRYHGGYGAGHCQRRHPRDGPYRPDSAIHLFPGWLQGAGRNAESAFRLIEDAAALEAAGAFSILLEAIPPEISRIITEKARIPIISIGAGLPCDGQLLIVHDMLGFFDRFTPKFVKKYADMNGAIFQAMQQYKEEVRQQTFPGKEHTYGMPAEEMEKLRNMLK
jgi:3-methyl-2-oxobutanoate hydroxymethyltransferase